MNRLLARRTEPSTKTGHERWLVSYADFITLLFGFFVVMYSVSQVNESKYRSLSETLNEVFAQDPLNGSNSERKDTPSSEQTRSVAEIKTLSEQIEQALKRFPVKGQVSLGANENWIELTLSSALLFPSGLAEPSDEAKQMFAKLATLLSPYENEIQIVGHTDNVPIRNARFANNWSLASARAVSIVNSLAYQGVNPDQMSAVSFGEFRPIADNLTEEGRAANRRVVLRISDQRALVSSIMPEAFSASDNTPFPSDSQSSEDSLLNLKKLEEKQAQQRAEPEIRPVRLKGGDLLFTSDPNLPRLRRLERDSETN